MNNARVSRFLLGWALAFLAFTAAAEPGVTDKEIVVGQSVDLSGPLAELGRDMSNGAKAYFEALNEKGGIHGRKLRLVTLDDGYKVANTVKNAQQLIETDQVFALLNIMGTPNSEAILPLVEKSGVPFFSPVTGAETTRSPVIAHVFNVRASYRDEAEKMVQHLSTVGIKRVAVLHQANSFGQDGLEGVQAAMAKRGMKPYATASIQSDASDADKAVTTLHDTRPEAIIMITAGKPSFEFIKRYNLVRRGMQFYTLSVMGANAPVRALGSDGVGVVVTTVVPYPWTQAHPLAKEYQAAMQKIGEREYSFLSFEGYINAKVLGEAMARTGRNLTRARMLATAESMKQVSLGGFDVSYSKESHRGSRYVDLTIIGPNGRFTK